MGPRASEKGRDKMARAHISVFSKWSRHAVHVQLLASGWFAAEATIAAVAAKQTGNLALLALSMVSAIELWSAMALSVRLWIVVETGEERFSNLATRLTSLVTGILLAGLACYLSLQVGRQLVLPPAWKVSALGFTSAIAASVITPWFVLQQRRLGKILGSSALLEAGEQGFFFTGLAWITLVALAVGWVVQQPWINLLGVSIYIVLVLKQGLQFFDTARRLTLSKEEDRPVL
jgi:divalent metal cation (Fe/Co/Zn/Cd) transporter